MVVYHLKGYVHTNKKENLCEQYCWFSDVFASMEQAVEAGKQEIQKRINDLYDEQEHGAYGELESFIKEDIVYDFTIMEFDMERRHSGFLRTDAENITLDNAVEFSSEVEWNFDKDGNLIGRYEWRGAGFQVHPEDYVEDAGTHIKLGDFVVFKKGQSSIYDDDGNSSRIYVVVGVPGSRKEYRNPLHWENIYCVYYLTGDEFTDDHHHVHESEIEIYTAEIEPDSPMGKLSRFVKEGLKQ